MMGLEDGSWTRPRLWVWGGEAGAVPGHRTSAWLTVTHNNKPEIRQVFRPVCSAPSF